MPEVIIGRNAVLEALRGDRRISKVLLDRSAKSDGRIDEILALAESKGIQVQRVFRDVLDRESDHGVHQGVAAHAEPLPVMGVDDLEAISAQKGEPPLYVVLDGIEDPHNLGAILRTCEATGVHGVVTRTRRAVGLTPSAMKAAAGAAEYMPLAQVPNISQAMERLKNKGVWTIGIDSRARDSYLSVDLRPATAIVVGAEGEGISELVKKNCDFLVSIPMKGKVSSLNASVAAAVVLYEVVRQRMSA